MTEGITCYERDERLCEDRICMDSGCRLRLGTESMQDLWRPISTAPIPASTEINPRTYIFRCLIQNKRDEVFEGEAHYVQVSRKSENWVLRWYIGHGRKLCNPQPIYWQPLPAPRTEK